MPDITALVIDDEPIAASRMCRQLEEQGVSVVAEAGDAVAALQKFEETNPDLVFLDIQMPGITGMQLAPIMMRRVPAPMLVFVTGYSAHAVDAFEKDALDYLVKPVSPERLAMTLARARQRLADYKLIESARRHSTKEAPVPEPPATLAIRDGFSIRFLPVDQLICAIAHDKKVYVHTLEIEHKSQYNLTQLESILPPDQFLRIHDSSLVNLRAIVELIFLGDHAYEVRLQNNLRLRVGRSRYAELQRRLGIAHNSPS